MSAQANILKYNSIEDLNIFLTVLKAPVTLVWPEAFLPGLWMVTFLLILSSCSLSSVPEQRKKLLVSSDSGP